MSSYPAHLSRTWTLPSGETLALRPVRHDDVALEEAFVRSLSRETGYQRMLTGGLKVTPEWLDRMTHIDYEHHMAFAVTTSSAGAEQFVAVGRYVVDAGKPSAEFAVVVADAWQRKGLGRRLLQVLLEHARDAGMDEMTGVVLATNTPMLRLAHSMGFAVTAEPDDATIRRIRRPLRVANSQSA